MWTYTYKNSLDAIETFPVTLCYRNGRRIVGTPRFKDEETARLWWTRHGSIALKIRVSQVRPSAVFVAKLLIGGV